LDQIYQKLKNFKKLNRCLNQVQNFHFYFSTLLNNDNHLINWIKTEIKLQNERNQNQEIELKRTGLTNEKRTFSSTFLVNGSKEAQEDLLIILKVLIHIDDWMLVTKMAVECNYRMCHEPRDEWLQRC